MKIHQCPICRKTFSKDSIIRIHLEQDHQIFDRKNLETITSEEYNIMRCHREIEKQNSQDGVYISGVFEYNYQDSGDNGEPSENVQQINEQSTQNSEENEETSQDEQQVHEESTQNSEENEETSQNEQQVHEESTQNSEEENEETSQDEENIEDSDEIPDFEENDLISCPFCNDDFTATNELTYHLAISHDAKLNMKTTVPLKNKRKSPVHEAENRVEFDEISTPEENNQNSEENEETSHDEQQDHEESTQNSEEMDEGDDEIPDFENEPKGTI